ncbi:hypothetical protein [Rubritalea sp.]|uniref:hypothetical protein n=1 Tax=Rubritalea sp. TaxID=2109375 RepID=UPI003EF55269
MSYTIKPTKASPAGCVFSLFGFIPIIFSLIFGYGFYKAISNMPETDSSLLWKFGLGSVACFIIGLVIIRIGWRMALGADMSDPYSDNKPKMRF